MTKAQADGLAVYHVVVKIDPHCAMPIAGRQLIHNALAAVGQVITVHPDAKSPAACKHVEFVLASAQTVQQITAKGRIPTISEEVTIELMLEPSAAPQTAAEEHGLAPDTAADANSPEAEASAPEAPAPSAPFGTVAATQENLLRVEASRIDSVLNLVGELIIGKSMLQQALNEFAKRYPKELLRGKFGDAMAFQARVLNDLQRSVMKIRMVPVDQLFRRFPRMVRDVSRQCGREVELDISGQDTDLDKGILDAIAEPLTHLVRNAVSHGIEPPEERRKLGKKPQGTIRLNAYHHGNQVVVEVTDDGRGIDAQKIRAKAIELGMTTAEEAARMTEAEVLDFIFRPGFSTAEQVTEVSGRGVGMDVVQSVLHRLKASISVETRPGQGTTFRLKLPLTLAIIKALLFWVEQRLYAIPLNAVLEIARTFETEVHQVDNYEVLQLRNQVLPLAAPGPSGGRRRAQSQALCAGHYGGREEVRLDCRFAGRRRGIGDQGAGRPHLPHRPGFRRLDSGRRSRGADSQPARRGGARSPLAAHRTGTLQFRPVVVAHRPGAPGADPRRGRSGMSRKTPVRVLVVDDSALMRKLIPQMLAADESIEVVGTAMDGNFCLKKIEELKPNVVTLDLEMPGMNGIDTLKEIMRRQPVPVIVFSSHSTEGASVTMKALGLGAFDFVTKPKDATAHMAETARELIAKVKAAAECKLKPRMLPGMPPRPEKLPAPSGSPNKVVAIGVSTGGPQALELRALAVAGRFSGSDYRGAAHARRVHRHVRPAAR